MSSIRKFWEIFFIFLKLGITSFGGPIAHIGYFRDEFVTRRQWLSERDYADLVALCQFLPGPASSQVGMALGMMRANYSGALAAWLGFTMPSACLLIAFAMGLQHWGAGVPTGLIHGLKLVAVAVVAQAVWGMSKSLCNSSAKITLMVATVFALSLWSSLWAQVVVIILGGLIGYFIMRGPQSASQSPAQSSEHLSLQVSKTAGAYWGAAFILLIILLPSLALMTSSPFVSIVDSFFRAGSLVFGGGHVVLPLLQAEVVPTGLVNAEQFMAGYGAAQAVPGPLFTFAAFLGASMEQGPSGIFGGLLALCAIFLPAFMILAAVLPYWDSVRKSPSMQAVMAGVGASVVGILLAALYNPIWTGAVRTPTDFAWVLVAYVALVYWKMRVWAVVLGSAFAGIFLSYLN